MSENTLKAIAREVIVEEYPLHHSEHDQHFGHPRKTRWRIVLRHGGQEFALQQIFKEKDRAVEKAEQFREALAAGSADLRVKPWSGDRG